MKIRWGVALSVALMVAVGAGRAISQEGPAIVHFGPPKAAQLSNRPKPETELIYNQSTPTAADFQSLPLAEGISVWQSVGPAPIANEALLGANGYCPPLPISEASGRTTAMAFGAGGAIYLGTAGGGVWKSVDGGNSWNVLTNREPSLAVGALAVVPGATTAQDVVYVGTGEPNNSADSLYGLGLLKSVNGGQTWTQLGFSTFTVLAFARIAVIPGAAATPTCCMPPLRKVPSEAWRQRRRRMRPQDYTSLWTLGTRGRCSPAPVACRLVVTPLSAPRPTSQFNQAIRKLFSPRLLALRTVPAAAFGARSMEG